MTNNAEVNYWKRYKEKQQERRKRRLPIRIAALLSLRKQGFTVEQKAAGQFRINGRLDIFPLHSCYTDIKEKVRGRFKTTTAYDIRLFVKRFFRKLTK